MYRLQRTHVVPGDDAALRRLGRSMGFRSDAKAELLEQWQRHRVAVRRLHEKLFYRPLLNAVARLDSGDARLSLEAASERLTALGYVDPQGALRHLEALSSGISRRAAIQRTLLPVLLAAFCYPIGNQLVWEAGQGHRFLPNIGDAFGELVSGHCGKCLRGTA